MAGADSLVVRRLARLVALVAVLATTTTVNARPPADSNAPHPVRAVRILGNVKTNEGTILRELTFHQGDSITSGEILESRQRIYNLGLFNSVSLLTTLDSATGVVDIYVVVAERWYVWPQLIVGVKDRDYAHMFSHGTKLFAGLGVLHFNVRGRNEKLYVMGVAGFDPNASMEYDYLALGEARRVLLSGSVSASRTLAQNDTVFTHGVTTTENAYGGALQMTFRATQRLNLSMRGEIKAVHPTNAAAHLALDPSGTDVLPTVTLSATYDSRDNAEYATDGSFHTAAIEKTGAGTIVNYGFASVDLRTYLPLYTDAALCLRGTTRVAFGGVVPVYAHQFVGLAERVRGQFGARREGESFALGTIEARLPVFPQRVVSLDDAPAWIPTEFTSGSFALYATIFADAGTTWFRYERPTVQQWLSGMGVGVNVLGPYGLVFRLESAFHASLREAEIIFDMGAAL